MPQFLIGKLCMKSNNIQFVVGHQAKSSNIQKLLAMAWWLHQQKFPDWNHDRRFTRQLSCPLPSYEQTTYA
jgi:hypothetical protein